MVIENILTALFISLCCFVLINLILSLILWKYSKHSVYQKIVKYWGATVVFFAFQFFFPHTPFQIALAFGVGILPMIYVYTLVYELLEIETKIFKFLAFHVLAMTLSVVFRSFDLGFMAIALPMSVSLSLPLLLAINAIFNTHRGKTTLLQSLLGGLLIFWIPHCFTFAFFRMTEGAQFFGWITSYTLYDIMAILLPAIALEETFKSQKTRLKSQVRLRTSELQQALGDKENLLRILVHDISNPLTVMRWYLTDIKKRSNEEPSPHIDKILKSQEIVENIVKKVKVLQTQPMSQSFVPISFSKCLEELNFVFEKALQSKNITLEISDKTNGNDIIMADQFSLTHNILSNFINNSIKFSFPNSKIQIMTFNQDDQLIVKIEDTGVGMSKELIEEITQGKKVLSSHGTQGEDGSGLGLSIAQNMLQTIGACLEIESIPKEVSTGAHGTKIILKFPIVSNSTVTMKV